MNGTRLRHGRLSPTRAAATLGLLACGSCGLPDTGILAVDASDPVMTDAGRIVDASVSRHDTAPPRDAAQPRDAAMDRGMGADTASGPPEAGVDVVQVPDVAPACTEACPVGAPCGSGIACTSGVCSDGNCVVAASCAAILTATPSATSGAYPIQPSGVGAPFTVYCDMTDMQGGWTLVAKMGTVGAEVMGATPQVAGTFDYSSTYWTLGTTLRTDSTDLSETEAMFASYSSVPFQSILGMMTAIPLPATKPTLLVVPLGDPSSLLHLIVSTNVNTLGDTLNRQDWLGLVPGSAVQPNCNEHGINWTPSNGCGAGGAKIRIGLIANNDNDCCSPDSYVGFGGEYDFTVCNQASYSAGSMGGQGCGGGNNVQDFGYLFVK